MQEVAEARRYFIQDRKQEKEQKKKKKNNVYSNSLE